MDRSLEISLDKLPIKRLEAIEEHGVERFPSDVGYEEKRVNLIRRIDFAWAVEREDPSKKQKKSSSSSSKEAATTPWPWQSMVENLQLAHQELSVIIDLIKTVEANDAVTVAGMTRPKQLPNELLSDLAVSTATKLQCFRHLGKYFKQSAKALEQQVAREARFYGALIRLQQNWKVKRQRVVASAPGNEGFYIDLFDNSLYDSAAVSRPSAISTVRIEHDPAGMLAVNLPPNSCRSLQFAFLGAHLGSNNEMKTHCSSENPSKETKKEPVSDDECVKGTHSVLREVHRAIFDEQVFDLVNREAFNPSLGANVTGIRENYLQLCIGQGASVFISLVPSWQDYQTVDSAGTQNMETAIVPLETFDGSRLGEGKNDTLKKKSRFPNRVSCEIYLEQLFHEHVLVRAKDGPISVGRTHLSNQSAKDGLNLLGHFCMSLAHRIFSNKVLTELENLVAGVPYVHLISHPTWHSRTSSWTLSMNVPQSILHAGCQTQNLGMKHNKDVKSQFRTKVVVKDDCINVEGEGAPNVVSLFKRSESICSMNRYDCDLADLPVILLQQIASQVIRWLHDEALMVGSYCAIRTYSRLCIYLFGICVLPAAERRFLCLIPASRGIDLSLIHDFSYIGIRVVSPEFRRSSTPPVQFRTYMASAVLASRNESSWGQSGGGFMGKLPYSNHLNPNPKTNSVPKKKQFHALGGQVNGRHAEDSQAVTQTASDDAYSFNQRSVESNSRADFNHGGYISFNIASYARSELIELKKRLVAELEQIRRLNDRIECVKFQPQSHGGGPQLPGKSKKLSGNKRPIPFASAKDPKRLCQTSSDNGIANVNEIGNLMKMCRQVLTKLTKHKHSWIFNKPVDAVAMGLHDYHLIIKHPMDLGTVKSNFGKNLYTSPGDFAADVRLTFNNALMYNPKGDEVHKMAEQLLARFEESYRPIQEKYEGDQRGEQRGVVVSDELQGSSWNRIPTPTPGKTKKLKSSSMPTPKKHEKRQMPASFSNPSSSTPPSVQSPVHTPSPIQAQPVKPALVRANPGKQPKPKAKDPNKRQMTMEEKHKLGLGLQSLPQEKMPQLVQIIRKRNEHLAQEGDEIELDIEALDTETLWELDRFVTNWKKMESKNKRQALMVKNLVAATASGEDNVLSTGEKTGTVKKPKKGEAGEEDVDIGDEMPMSSFPPVEIEKDDGGHDNSHATSSSSSSGSSSSGSSSSSDSDSGSSSGSDSDADEAQSRGLESKEFPKT